MKRCPECRRDYYDDSLLYCLEDGAALVQGSVSLQDEPQTAILHETAPSSEAQTKARIYSTEQTATLPSEAANLPKAVGFFDKRLLLALLAVAVIALGSLFGYRYFRPWGTGSINSIAVLPFENSSDNADSEYLSDGLAESLIYRLTQIPELKVSPRSSVFRYKGKDIDVERIGTDLGVDAVMSGRFVKRGDNLTISVDLVDVRAKKTLWGEQFERKMSDLLATQREIAAAITQNLQLKLSGEAATGITKRYTDSNEAYQLYLQGRFYWNKRTPEAIPKAVELLKQAVEKDPNFALAYSGLADAQIVAQYLTRKWDDGYGIPEATENANRALQLDPTLAEPHATLGLINQYLWKWDESEKEFKRAIELNPKYATSYHWYSRLLRVEGRYEEALVQIRKAQEADPLSLVIAENVAQNLLENGNVDAAIEQCKRTIDLDPGFWVIHMRLAAAYFEKGEKDDGLAEATRAYELVNRATTAMGFFGYAQAMVGNRDEALAIVKEMEKRYSDREVDGVRIASVYVGLGDKDKVFEWLEKEFQARRPSLIEIYLEPEFRSLRSDPRYKDLLRRMNLPARNI